MIYIYIYIPTSYSIIIHIIILTVCICGGPSDENIREATNVLAWLYIKLYWITTCIENIRDDSSHYPNFLDVT